MTSPPRRVARIGLAFLATSALWGATSHAGADPLGCDATVHDPEELLDRGRLDPVIASAASKLGGDVRVRVEGVLDGGLDQRIDQLIEQCPGWQDTDTDELADDMVVVAFSPDERENSIFYGADLGPELEDRWDAAASAMIPPLRTGGYTDAVIAGLRGLTRDPISSTTSSEGGDGVPGGVIFWVIVLAGVVVVSYVARQQGWTSAGSGSWHDRDDGGSRRWLGSSRRRSSFGFGSSGSRSRSSGGSSRRSGGGSRRAGGGSKKW